MTSFLKSCKKLIIKIMTSGWRKIKSTSFFSLTPELQTKIFSYFEEETLLEVRSACKSFKNIVERNVGMDCTLEGYIQPRGCTFCQGTESENLYPKLNFFLENTFFIRRLTINRWYPEKDGHTNTIIRKLIREPDRLEWLTLRRLEMNFLYETLDCTRHTLVHLTQISVTDITTRYNMQKIIHQQKYKNPIYMEQLRTFNLRLEFSIDEHDFLESFYLLLLIKAPNLQELGIVAEYMRKPDNLQLDMTCNLLGVVAHFLLGVGDKLKHLWIWKNHISREVYRCTRCNENGGNDRDLRDETHYRLENDDDLHSSTKVPTTSLEEIVKCANNPQLNEIMAMKDIEKKLECVRKMLLETHVTSLESLNVRMATPRESLLYNGLIGNQTKLNDLKVQLDYLNVGSDENPPWKQVLTNMVEPVKGTIEKLGFTARFKKTVDLAATFKGYSNLKSLHLWQYGGGRVVSPGDRQHHYSYVQYDVRWIPPKKFAALADQDFDLQEYPFINDYLTIEKNENYDEEEEDENEDENEDGEENEDEEEEEEEDEDEEEEENEDEEENEADNEDEDEDEDMEVDAGIEEEIDGQNNLEDVDDEERDNEEEENSENEDETDEELDKELPGIQPIYSSDEENWDDDNDFRYPSTNEADVEIKIREISNTEMEIQLFPNLINLQIADSFPALESLTLTCMNLLPSEFSKTPLEQFENLKVINIDMGRDLTVYPNTFGIELPDLLEYTKLRKLNKLRILPIRRHGQQQDETERAYFQRILNDTEKQLVRNGVLELPAAYY